jgi:sulfatase modifying factor 1
MNTRRMAYGRTDLWIRHRGGGLAAVVLALSIGTAAAAPFATEMNSVGMRLVRIPTGDFEMGSRDAPDELRSLPGMVVHDPADEHPIHLVRITRPFWIATHETTLGQFLAFCRETGHVPTCRQDGLGGEGWTGRTWDYAARFGPESWGFPGQTPAHPVVNVTWKDAVAFCNWLSRKERQEYRLPTEAEWEYCCRAGSATRFPHGSDMRNLHRHGNICDQASRGKWANPENVVITIGDGGLLSQALTEIPYPFHPGNDGFAFTASGGRFPPNAWGLHDMIGNVGEWCADRYADDWYAASPTRDPIGPSVGSDRVIRGSSHKSLPVDSRSAARSSGDPQYRSCSLGFRVVRAAW